MRAVLDTNVLISGIFFGGPPRSVLDAWAAGRFELVMSPAMVDEYVRTCDRLGASHPDLEYHSILASIVVSGDRHLLEAAGWQGARVMKPRDFPDLLVERAE